MASACKYSYLVRLEADPLVGGLADLVVVVRRPQVLLRLTQEALRLRRLRVAAAERRRHVEVVAGARAVLAREVLLVSLALLTVLLRALVRLLEVELVGVVEVRLERLARGERVARVEVEVEVLEGLRSRQALRTQHRILTRFNKSAPKRINSRRQVD